MTTRHRGLPGAFTLIELLVVISIIALLIAILLPALGAARRTARAMQSNTQVRGIQQGMFIFSNDAKGLYPGLDKLTDEADPAFTDASRIKTYSDGGSRAGAHVAARYAICLEENYFTPVYLISPFEVNPQVVEWEADTVYTEATGQFYSYALPRIQWFDGGAGAISPGRAREWRAEANASSVVISDRLFGNAGNISIFNADTYLSLQDPDSPGKWLGGISYNDNHTETQIGAETDGPLVYAGYNTVGVDNIFDPTQPAGQGTVPTNANQYNAQQIIHGYDGLFLLGE